jgi:hypothetical protein
MGRTMGDGKKTVILFTYLGSISNSGHVLNEINVNSMK